MRNESEVQNGAEKLLHVVWNRMSITDLHKKDRRQMGNITVLYPRYQFLKRASGSKI